MARWVAWVLVCVCADAGADRNATMSVSRPMRAGRRAGLSDEVAREDMELRSRWMAGASRLAPCATPFGALGRGVAAIAPESLPGFRSERACPKSEWPPHRQRVFVKYSTNAETVQ